MIKREEKQRKLRSIEQDFISLYNLKVAEKDIRNGNENVRVLYHLLLKEINLHNGNVRKRHKKVMNLPTSD